MRHFRRARFRNPNYAPEFLERKLSPSSLLGTTATTAYVSTATANATVTSPAPETTTSPIVVPSSGSDGPSGPA